MSRCKSMFLLLAAVSSIGFAPYQVGKEITFDPGEQFLVVPATGVPPGYKLRGKVQINKDLYECHTQPNNPASYYVKCEHTS